MIEQLMVATVMVMATVTIHGVGLFALARLLRMEEGTEREFHFSIASPRGLVFTLMLVIALFALHGVEIWLYGALYLWLGALPDLATAVYFSTITYGTVGYDDEGVTASWKLIAAIEGINGVILLGWSTAFFVTVIHRVRGPTR
ncbi:ion channel [Sphingomonas sp. LY29]|uniref:ion channel n=1 Tax=Sphingomonas sp. LY29 TaxID=3095341 RepID=UPI002D78976E|nr:ion channel [Sphingomonas sp. LY29]WRP24863.1 ion channel [Sphingomonas sp. LY29]